MVLLEQRTSSRIPRLTRILIEHGNLLAEPAAPLRYDCPVAIEGRTILAVGQQPPQFAPDEVIDASDCLVLPGLFNAHCHSPMTLVRGWAEDLPFDRWLNERIWVAESVLQPEDVYWGAALAACELIRAGVVAFADHYFWMDRVAQVVQESGMKALLAWCVFGGDPQQEVGHTTFDTICDFTRQWHTAADGRIRTALGPHSPYMCPPAFLRQVARTAEALDVPVHLHLAESDEQVRRSLDQHGRTPVAQLEALGLMEQPLLAAHCISVDEADIELLARRKVFVAHTPKTYMKLAMGMPPLALLWQAGVTVALGTDGPASNSDLNLLEAMRLTGLVQKLQQSDPEAAPLRQLLGMATRDGARALGFDESGAIAPGAPADIVVVDTRGAHWTPRHDLVAGLVYASHPSDVTHLLVDGQLLLRKGELTTLDEERIRHEAERRARRLVGAPRMSRLRSYES